MDGRRSQSGATSPSGMPSVYRHPTQGHIIDEEVEEITRGPQPTLSSRDTLEGDQMASGSTSGANMGHTPPERATMSQELEEMRQWYKETKEREELESLRAMRAQYETGDRTMFQRLNGTKTNPLIPRPSSANLPKPEPPKVYHKRDRAEYNRWERDCESFFLRAPDNFITEEQKVEFGTRYISETLRALWRSYCETQFRIAPLWAPNWATLKTVMLDSLGTPLERKQQAYEALKRCHQRHGQTPTDLLEYMRPLWEELGLAHSPEMQTLEFMAALNTSIQSDLYLLPSDRRSTLPIIEEQANVIHRRKNRHNGDSRSRKDYQSDQKSRKGHKLQSGSEGDSRPPKKKNYQAKSQQRGNWPNKPQNGGLDNISPTGCYNCGEEGHARRNCPKLTAEQRKKFQERWDSYQKRPNQLGKGKGFKD
jgi:hypothetical protein